ncbi:phage major tail tube protein [Serratia fonticola]
MALPKKLKYLNIYNAGSNFRGVAESMTLPKLTRKLENYRGGGMNGSAPIDLGLDDDALSMEWTLGGLDLMTLGQLGDPIVDNTMLRFVGSFEDDSTGEVSAVEVVLRGRHKELDLGEYKQGENSQTKISTQCTYYKMTIDGQDWVEIDVINFVEIIGGVDRLAKHRTILGL